MKRNRELLTELRSIQGSYAVADKQQRYTVESVKALESELSAVRNNRDEICCDVKNVVGYVRSWLQEQRKIDEYTAKRERDYCHTIRRLRRDYEYVWVILNACCVVTLRLHEGRFFCHLNFVLLSFY